MMERAGASAIAPWEIDPHRLWSLWEMLKVSAREYLQLGSSLEENRAILFMAGEADPGSPQRELNDLERKEFRGALQKTLEECKKLDLPICEVLVTKSIEDLPQTVREFDILVRAIYAEIDSKLFLFIPAERAKYYEIVFPSVVTIAFPMASAEMLAAGNSLAAALYTGCVFHAMRAAEIGVRVMATELGVTFSFPIEFAEWGKIVGELEPKIKAIENQPRSVQREADLAFYSEAASQFRYFNSGWRVRNSHARASFDEPQARMVFDHTLAFFQTLATRLKE